METMRDPVLETFLSSVHDALANRPLGEDATAAIARIEGALEHVVPAGPDRAARLPVCDRHLSAALDSARRHGPDLARIADAFAAIEPRLHWAPRSAGGPHASANWPEGHANAMVFGPGGLEHRNDVQVGASLRTGFLAQMPVCDIPKRQGRRHRHEPRSIAEGGRGAW